ncbi:MAG: gliding motility-associated C-terminal domain-containing protein [Bacteroidales bacterium]|nr:gliding motility-associated C-terminal domain-containing protein [Bacteroidales bacterium]
MSRILTAIMLLWCVTLNAQTIETPEILSVSVDTVTGRPVIRWKMNNPQSVDGYVVKRLIYDGVGVMPDTYNNITVIDNNGVFEFVDNSTEYSTKALPDEREEKYRVAAFVDNGQQRKYSLMSEEVSTIITTASYDKCTREYSLHWTGELGVDVDYFYVYSGVNGFGSRIAVVSADTVFSTTFDDFVENRTFGVEAVLKNGETMFSPLTRVFAPKVDVPDIKVVSVSVNEQNTLDITVNVAESQDVVKTVLIRRLSVGSGFESDTLELPVNANGNYVITDPNADVSTRYDYLIAVFGECGTPLEFSYAAQNIVLEVSTDDATSNHLSWNYPPGYSAASFAVFLIDDNGERTVLDNVSMETEYTHSLSNIIANSNHNTGKFCYQVLLSDLSSSQSDNAVQYSNIVCVDREPVLFVPNAINPDADILDNRYFRPRSGFINDYKMNIYNKRGELLFTTTDPEEGWDGKNQSGKLYPPDSYVYIITYRTSSNDKKQKTGMVNLVY